MYEEKFYKVRTVIQNSNNDLFVKHDYYSTLEDAEDYIEGNFTITTRNFYEKHGFDVLTIQQKEIIELDYINNTK